MAAASQWGAWILSTVVLYRVKLLGVFLKFLNLLSFLFVRFVSLDQLYPRVMACFMRVIYRPWQCIVFMYIYLLRQLMPVEADVIFLT